ncbi:MAG TPA: hypothetical protein VGC13_31220 [Longimicrobium sp.]|jgi:hypothetical protein|uniref:hypothetical protein n=1 Tax=Longimicrobium sp. TaxID=2029185 RepID=UPI002EDB00BC
MSDQKDSPYESSYLSSFGLALGMAIGQDDVLRAWESRWAESQKNAKARLLALFGDPQAPKPLKPLEIPERTHATFSSYAGSQRDYVFGDALVAVGGRGFIVEFKRRLGGWKKEIDPNVKPHKVRVLQRVSKHRPNEEGKWIENEDADMEMYNISRDAHWFAYGKTRRAAKNGLLSAELCFAPYVTLPLGPAGIRKETELLAPFLSSLVGGGRGVELRILSEYLTCVQDAALDDDKKGGSASPVEAIKANGIFVYFDTEGRCRMFRFRSIQELREKVGNLSLVNPPAETPVQTGKPVTPESRVHTKPEQSAGKKIKGP